QPGSPRIAFARDRRVWRSSSRLSGSGVTKQATACIGAFMKVGAREGAESKRGATGPRISSGPQSLGIGDPPAERIHRPRPRHPVAHDISWSRNGLEGAPGARRSSGVRSGGAGPTDVELLHPRTEGAGLEAEKRRGAVV